MVAAIEYANIDYSVITNGSLAVSLSYLRKEYPLPPKYFQSKETALCINGQDAVQSALHLNAHPLAVSVLLNVDHVSDPASAKYLAEILGNNESMAVIPAQRSLGDALLDITCSFLVAHVLDHVRLTALIQHLS